ncbi:SAM-dependent methyltransferase [Microbacterium flavum]|uniref:SAM-dependent methyltransferase n=1 Tax=Microbacterium flavum TaxID=415216 RepID=A0ABS5XXB6_9MICO|nr:SAM-dependent methyltransferase [Microbacterium flavum]MBT8799172.1 SAM-dependent methyltransferase [Microbacterium flavum]
MSWPFLYFAGDRLSIAELCSARLDGDLVEIGDAFMPTDAVETRELRAASFRGSAAIGLAITRESAAWVHGALPQPPPRHSLQRRSGARGRPLVDLRVRYRDQPIASCDLLEISGVWVTTPARTLADLVRARYEGEDVAAAVDALLAWRPALAAEARDILSARSGLHFKRPAMRDLRRLIAPDPSEGAQEEVTR